MVHHKVYSNIQLHIKNNESLVNLAAMPLEEILNVSKLTVSKSLEDTILPLVVLLVKFRTN